MDERFACDLSRLIPEVSQWNDGKGVDPEVWICGSGTYELALGYSLIFWPKFVRFEGYVLREGFSLESLRAFEDSGGDRWSVEAVMNHIHLDDLHHMAAARDDQLRYLGGVLKEIYEVKLQHDFPDSRFKVAFNEGAASQDDLDDQLTFWRSR